MSFAAQLLQELDEARAKMREITTLTGENTEIYAPWKMKEVLAHLTGWDDATIAALQAHARGEVPTTPAERGIDFYNAQTVSTREELPYAHIVREWEKTRELLKQVLCDLPEEKFAEPLIYPWGPTGTVPQIVRIMIHHEHEHADEIRGLLSQG